MSYLLVASAWQWGVCNRSYQGEQQPDPATSRLNIAKAVELCFTFIVGEQLESQNFASAPCRRSCLG